MDIRQILDTSRTEMVEDLPWSDYRRLAAINASTLVHGRKSMRHLKWAWDHPDTSDSPAKQWGRAVHALLLEPKTFHNRFWSWNARRQGRAYESLCDSAILNDAEILTEQQFDAVQQAAKQFVACPEVKTLINSGKAEVTLLAVEQGLQCKSRLDWVATCEHIITDVKTSRDISDRAFDRDFFKLHYHVKLGLYQHWFEKVVGEVWPVSVMIQENLPPYDARVKRIDQSVLDLGREIGLSLLASVARCLERDRWPGLSETGDPELFVPSWVMDEQELLDAEEAG